MLSLKRVPNGSPSTRRLVDGVAVIIGHDHHRRPPTGWGRRGTHRRLPGHVVAVAITVKIGPLGAVQQEGIARLVAKARGSVDGVGVVVAVAIAVAVGPLRRVVGVDVGEVAVGVVAVAITV